MTTSTIQNKPKQSGKIGTVLKTSAIAIGLSTVANLALYGVSGLINPAITQWGGAGAGQIVGANIIYLLVGTAVFLLVSKFSRRPAPTYWVVATVGLLGSLWLPASAALGQNLPAGAEPASIATAIVLGLMHVISYAISTPLFVRTIQ